MARSSNRAHRSLVAGVVWALAAAAPAAADDTERYVRSAGETGRPNVLFIIDNSAGTAREWLTQNPFDATVAYPGGCPTGRVYWRRNGGAPPACNSDNWFDDSALVCAAAQRELNAGRGWYFGYAGRFDPTVERWIALDSNEKRHDVECADDGGLHGVSSVSTDRYARNGDAGSPWSADPLDEVSWGQAPLGAPVTVYSANYLNWYTGTVAAAPGLEIIKGAAMRLLDGLDGVNVGLMSFNIDEGAYVLHAVEPVETARASLMAAIAGLTPRAQAPLSEALYEAALYLRGDAVDYGDRQGPPNSVDAARTAPGGGRYASPIVSACEQNFAVILSAAVPSADTGANFEIASLPGFADLVGPACDGTGDGACLDDLAEYLHKADASPAIPGLQNVVTHTVGFGVDYPLLENAAQRGGGGYLAADDLAGLDRVLHSIAIAIDNTRSTIGGPALASTTFGRGGNPPEVFATVFEPATNTHWPGNLKKYRFDGGRSTIVDADGSPVVDPESGSLSGSSRGLWSGTVDGADVRAGGAANRLPPQSGRRLYTYLGNRNLTDVSNRVDGGNALIDYNVLDLYAPGDPVRADVIEFARGRDLMDADRDGDSADERFELGDSLHTKPVSVGYGSNSDRFEEVVFIATNDGYLHAVDGADGSERWAFIAPEFLADLVRLYTNEPTPIRHYGIDGALSLQLADGNDDRLIDSAAGDTAYLFFGLQRGGGAHYALDVSDPDRPHLLWRVDARDLPDLGQTWSRAAPARVTVGAGAGQNPGRHTIVLGGGYDPTQDALPGSMDSSGNSLYMLDSVSGRLLWRAGRSGADLDAAAMRYSIPSAPKVVDLDSDGFADRIYAADMGGQIWRFDLFNGREPSALVTGGVIAQLGGAPQRWPAPADTRRFYASPDVALVDDGAATFMHIGVGSGHRARPNSVAAHDAFFALRDYAPFEALTQDDYDSLAASPITPVDLTDVTADPDVGVPPGSPGWRLELRDSDWIGEKVLAEARAFDNRVFFTTYVPPSPVNGPDCLPQRGESRLYVADIVSGGPAPLASSSRVDSSTQPRVRYTEVAASVTNDISIVFPEATAEDCIGAACQSAPAVCVGLSCFAAGFAARPVPTFWSRDDGD